MNCDPDLLSLQMYSPTVTTLFTAFMQSDPLYRKEGRLF